MAATPMDKMHYIQLLEKGLESAVKEVLEDKVIKAALQEYEDMLRPKIHRIVDDITLRGVVESSHMHNFEDEIKIYWTDNSQPSLKTTRKNEIVKEGSKIGTHTIIEVERNA